MPSAATTGDTVATTRFSGRAFSVRELALIRDVVRECSGLSRMELARTVCELLRWRRPNGRLKARECREFLERLDAEGALVLPDKRRGPLGSVTRVPRTAACEPGRSWLAVPRCRAAEVRVGVRACPRLLFRELVGRYHYLGHKVPFGAHLRYLVASRPRVRWSAACSFRVRRGAWRCGTAVGRVGSGAESAARGQPQPLPLLPWVTVKNLLPSAVRLAPRAVRWTGRGATILSPLVETLWMLVTTAVYRAARCVGRHETVAAGWTGSRRVGAADGSGSSGPGCAAAVAGALSDSRVTRPVRWPRAGAVCGGRCRLCGCQVLSVFARSPSDERRATSNGNWTGGAGRCCASCCKDISTNAGRERRPVRSPAPTVSSARSVGRTNAAWRRPSARCRSCAPATRARVTRVCTRSTRR